MPEYKVTDKTYEDLYTVYLKLGAIEDLIIGCMPDGYEIHKGFPSLIGQQISELGEIIDRIQQNMIGHSEQD